jgi:hypothetical protein
MLYECLALDAAMTVILFVRALILAILAYTVNVVMWRFVLNHLFTTGIYQFMTVLGAYPLFFTLVVTGVKSAVRLVAKIAYRLGYTGSVITTLVITLAILFTVAVLFVIPDVSVSVFFISLVIIRGIDYLVGRRLGFFSGRFLTGNKHSRHH